MLWIPFDVNLDFQQKFSAGAFGKGEDSSGFASYMKSGHSDLGVGNVIISGNRKGGSC